MTGRRGSAAIRKEREASADVGDDGRVDVSDEHRLAIVADEQMNTGSDPWNRAMRRNTGW